MNWRYRAQRNPYGVQPLIVITKGWPYDKAYRLGADEDMRALQLWTYQQVGKTFRTIPAAVVRGEKTVDEYAAGNIYLDIHWQLGGHPTLNLCNFKRLFVLYSTGYTGLKNMAGRSAFGCPDMASNPLEPWGPGRAGGPSGWAMELTAGHPVENAPQTRTASRGALLHEMMHCLGIQHPDESIDGPQAWLSPMAGWWFGVPGADNNGNPTALLPREIRELRGETTGAGAHGTSPKPGAHFLR